MGAAGAREILVEAPRRWPRLDLEVLIDTADAPSREYVDEANAVVRPRSGGWIEIDRHRRHATFFLPNRPSDPALVHPHLASVAIVSAHWLGRESFHAGGFLLDGRAWGVLGQQDAGKSSFLALLALAGIPVLCDDVLILEEATAFAGPRSIDLRASATAHLGVGEPLGVVGKRERWRLSLPQVRAEVPLAGWVSLCWGERVEVRRLQGADRLRTIGGHRGSSLYPPNPAGLIDLSGLPVLEFRRPRRWDLAEEAVHRLIDALG